MCVCGLKKGTALTRDCSGSSWGQDWGPGCACAHAGKVGLLVPTMDRGPDRMHMQPGSQS